MNFFYFKYIADGYLISVGLSEKPIYTEITFAEYEKIKSVVHEKPTAPDGYEYRLTADLLWELHEIPANDVATEADYLAALARLGVE